MLSATSTIRIHFIIYLLWARRIHRRKHPAPTQTICDRAAPRSAQTWKGVTENKRVREGEEAVSQVSEIQTGRQNNSIYSVSDIAMLPWVKKPRPSVMQTNIQTDKQTAISWCMNSMWNTSYSMNGEIIAQTQTDLSASQYFNTPSLPLEKK